MADTIQTNDRLFEVYGRGRGRGRGRFRGRGRGRFFGRSFQPPDGGRWNDTGVPTVRIGQQTKDSRQTRTVD